MKAIMVMFDSLNRRYLPPYGDCRSLTPNFERLARHTVAFRQMLCRQPALYARPQRAAHRPLQFSLPKLGPPIEPYDGSMPEILKNNGIRSHLVSDHSHYWEDGGANYHTRYATWENIRGTGRRSLSGRYESKAGYRTEPDTLFRDNNELFHQDLINRSYIRSRDDFPQTKTVSAGIELIDINHTCDNWFLQVECFDPHEPFFSSEEFQQLYPKVYDGGRFDWPDYAALTETPRQTEEARRNYMALLSMCDWSLGRILDKFDEYDLWKDTLLIVNTDHGYMLGEHNFWAKNYMPFYQELVHLPLFIWDPVSQKCNTSTDALVQTIDLPATLLDYFALPKPGDMSGNSILPHLRKNKSVREAALFGIHGGHICCTDGRYIFMKAPVHADNAPLYEYTLMPAHTTTFFTTSELENARLHEPFPFTKNMPVLQCPTHCPIDAHKYGDLLFDLQTDYAQQQPLKDTALTERMTQLMLTLMKQNDAPQEQYLRVGLSY